MSLKTLTKLALGGAIASISFIAVNAPAQGALLGDTVRGTLSAAGFGTIFSTTAVVVDPGIEFSFGGGYLDVKNDSFDIIYDLTGTGDVGATTFWVLSDLDWVDSPGIVTDVTLTSGNPAEITGISFTDDSIVVSFINVQNPPVIHAFSFDIQTEHESTPEPSTMLGLLTLAGLGVRLKRNVG